MEIWYFQCVAFFFETKNVCSVSIKFKKILSKLLHSKWKKYAKIVLKQKGKDISYVSNLCKFIMKNGWILKNFP